MKTSILQVILGFLETFSYKEFWQTVYTIAQHRQQRKDVRFEELTEVRSVVDMITLENKIQDLNKEKYQTLKKSDRLQHRATNRDERRAKRHKKDLSEDSDDMQRRILYIAIHCSATGDQDITASEIRGWHVKDRGWKDIGYHFFIRRDGSLELGRDLDKDGYVLEEIGAHVSGFNTNSLAICWAGGADGLDNRTESQIRTLDSLILILHEMFPEAQIAGHRDFPGVAKACPSYSVADQLKRLNIDHSFIKPIPQ